MKWIAIILTLFAVVLLTSWYFYEPSEYQLVKQKGNEVIEHVGKNLKKELLTAIKQKGIVNAVSFCNTRALQITEESGLIFSEDILVKRVSDKPRNPANKAEDYELSAMEHFRKSGALTDYYIMEITKDDKPISYKYFKPIYIETACLTCHGGAEVPQEVDSVLQKLYPNDEARGYKKGDLRGLFTVDIPAKVMILN